MLAAVLLLINVSPATALDFNPADYFDLSYDPVTFDKTEITGSDVFHAIVAGRAVCSQDLPVSASEAIIISSVVARHSSSGTMVTLNPEYIVTIEPFPNEEGDTIEISQSVPLQFPAGAASGEYNVIGRLVNATVKVSIIPVPVTPFLPQEQSMGTVKYTAPDSASVQVTTTPPAEVTPPPSSPTPAASPSPEPAEPLMSWWVELIVFIAIATTVFNIAWFLRHRRR